MSGSKDLKPEEHDKDADTRDLVGTCGKYTAVCLGILVYNIIFLVVVLVLSGGDKGLMICYSNPCLNGGNCKQENNTYTCACTASRSGLNCENKVALCVAEPCLNGGNCTQDYDMYTCTCPRLYVGQNCENKDIMPCNSDPCRNGGNCTAVNNMYTCFCNGPHYGRHCENRRLMPCDSDPCLNGGNCMDGKNMYTCACTVLHGGQHCEKQINCASQPCLNGGSCTQGKDTYSCTCANSNEGYTCAKTLDGCDAVSKIKKMQCMYDGVTQKNCSAANCCYDASLTPACFQPTPGTQVKGYNRVLSGCDTRVSGTWPIDIKECAKKCKDHPFCLTFTVCTTCNTCEYKNHRCTPKYYKYYKPGIVTFELIEVFPEWYVCKSGSCIHKHYSVTNWDIRNCYRGCMKDKKCLGITFLNENYRTRCKYTYKPCYKESELDTTILLSNFCFHKQRAPYRIVNG